MVRDFLETDLGNVAEIWLDTNRDAHSFIPAQYWESHFDAVKQAFAQAELYVYEDKAGIQGFIGLDGEHVAGIFVRGGAQSKGIGRQLLEHAKCRKGRLRLSVYQKNARAIAFYQREGFAIQAGSTDAGTGEKEYAMLWEA